MATHPSHAALPYPIRGAPFTVPIPYLDAGGEPTDPTSRRTPRSVATAPRTRTAPKR